jgi:hypothetical protein
MFPLGKQIEVTCDTAKNGVMRLSGKEAPAFADGDYSLEAFRSRIEGTLAYLDTVTEGDFADAETRTITLSYFPDKPMEGYGYATEYVLPNFFFHMTAAYAILRKNGVPLGKTDYIGSLPFSDQSA